MKKLQILLAALLLCGAASAQERAFQAGEELVYAASYKVGFIEPNLATVKLNVTNSTVDGIQAYRLTGVGEVSPAWKWVFDMRDEYNTWIDRETRHPIYTKTAIREGTYRMNMESFYDWDAYRVVSQWTNLKDNKLHEKKMPLTPRSFDGVTMFYSLRATIQTMKPGESAYIDVVMRDTVKHLMYKYIGPEERTLAGLGRYRTHKFSCQLTNSTDEREAFPDGTEFFIWFSDDKNRIPLYLETPIRVGTVKCSLASYKGLRYPLGGKVK